MNPTKPFLKWAGGKYRQLSRILAVLPPGRRLIEPFTGSGAVFINTSYREYILGEANPDLVALFTHIQQDGCAFIDWCESFFTPQNNTEDRYYAFRERFNASKDSRERSALFIYMNRHGYNGLCRYNRRGGFNVPFGRYAKPGFPRREMEFFQQKSQNARFVHCDFRETFMLAEPGDIIYCDPPYVPLSPSANFSTYTGSAFGEDDHIALAHLARSSRERGVPVVISNHDTPFTRTHYIDASIEAFRVRRHISCLGTQRGFAPELLAFFEEKHPLSTFP
ncbi:DNA adenine methylase [Legionella geestiana]|uniref:Site-specific DNA-methyltransferase (adenine-specific) n=1 Tax=Legionella geestiana TaxID=45065 RepID=A0A0W0TLV9_9GAMM|nr:Dam family site-specific DNA-(adenine-N6)-methyltransferase [Legionella geestiana]KTC96493.1 DNA adenine methylase [Legionella geestiana]QBS12534.1 Dam family site-specific DNA-(adenine-N6)-methyltransferase [Legionella geestiana]QDQ39750.1 Dam family site-specific DNA-(adenine-N6)-methyltransferase [Legionella geestiana]STX55019.1 DNA adenine methylase [Legionella geestiana]